MGLHGVVRGKPVRTTIARRQAAPCPLDLVKRQFQAPRPNQLWVADFTYVATWARLRLRRLRHRRVRAAHRRLARVALGAADFVLDALEQALCDALGPSRRRSCITAIAACNTCRFATPSGWPKPASSRRSAASATSYDNALAETIIGLYKTEVIQRRGPWRQLEAVEFATLEWVDWFNHRRLLEPIGYIPPAEAEARYYAQTASHAMAA